MSVNKICVQCNQVVYALEQLKCLDQIWHRRCFRCVTCGMALTMGSYRGYDKKPYCPAHYPQPKRFTLVSDTPEFQRVAQNTRLFSKVHYNQRQSSLCSPTNRDAPRNFRSASSVDLPPDSPVTVNQRDRLHKMGQSLQVHENYRYENGATRRVPSPSPAYLSTLSESRDSAAETHSPVNVSNPASHVRNTVNSERQQAFDGKQAPKTDSQLKFKAIFDYEAKEDDEVSFCDGDIIIHGDPITDGWMYGTVQRTGQFGMLPSNYVEPIE